MSAACRDIHPHQREACGPECAYYDVTDESPCACGHGLWHHAPSEDTQGGACVVAECRCPIWRDAGS